MSDEKSKWMLMSVPGPLHRRIKSEAAKLGITMQRFVLDILNKKVGK